MKGGRPVYSLTPDGARKMQAQNQRGRQIVMLFPKYKRKVGVDIVKEEKKKKKVFHENFRTWGGQN